jgi:hypothetical protein
MFIDVGNGFYPGISFCSCKTKQVLRLDKASMAPRVLAIRASESANTPDVEALVINSHPLIRSSRMRGGNSFQTPTQSLVYLV